MIDLIIPEWPVPPHVRAFSTTRVGGVSAGPFGSLNLGTHVKDEPDCVTENRRRLREQIGIEQEPCWLRQVHGTNVVRADAQPDAVEADGAFTTDPEQICAILTADCLPVLFANTAGTRVAAAHAGWRGLSAGVLEAAVAALATPARDLLAWLGPAIGPEHFEVGEEVRAAFTRLDPAAATAFRANARGRWQADLYRLARQHLNRLGLDAVYGGGRCTFAERDVFFSHRRDGNCGRMATLIWRE